MERVPGDAQGPWAAASLPLGCRPLVLVTQSLGTKQCSGNDGSYFPPGLPFRCFHGPVSSTALKLGLSQLFL